MDLIGRLFSDPIGTLTFFLLALPGRMLAISAHEAAHGWVANRCGDPTARLMGRITLNPIKHFDLLGTLMLLLVGFGWAKPVPVNPLHFRKYRRDDLLVSLAGVTANLCLFLVCIILIYSLVGASLAQLPSTDSYLQASIRRYDRFLTQYNGTTCLFWEGEDSLYYATLRSILMNPLGYTDTLIQPVFGQTVGHLFQMVSYCMLTNLMLILFNLIPLPPLDGYHVLNDLFLKRPLFASPKTQQITSFATLALVVSGILGRILSAASDVVFQGVASAAQWAFSLLHIL